MSEAMTSSSVRSIGGTSPAESPEKGSGILPFICPILVHTFPRVLFNNSKGDTCDRRQWDGTLVNFPRPAPRGKTRGPTPPKYMHPYLRSIFASVGQTYRTAKRRCHAST